MSLIPTRANVAERKHEANGASHAKGVIQVNGLAVRRDAAHRRVRLEGRVRPPRLYLSLKQALEWLAALVLLGLSALVILVAAVVVKLTSRGPAFYKQTRVGRNGRLFVLYKVRTMIDGAERESGPCWATPDDDRVTPIGRFLRRTHIDELPQLWNVLRGDMNLVGPRPERPEFVVTLAEVIPLYQERLAIRPGISGLAQVRLPPDTDLDGVRRKLAYDLYYVRHMGLRTDVHIALRTLCAAFLVPHRIARKLFPLPDAKVIEGSYQQLREEEVDNL